VLLRLFLEHFHPSDSPARDYLAVQAALLVAALLPASLFDRTCDGLVHWLSPFWEYE
jgi:hypothetical protein